MSLEWADVGPQCGRVVRLTADKTTAPHGAVELNIGEDGTEEVVVRAGEVLHLPGNVPRAAVALEDTLDVDVFCPPREDWLNKTDAYLKK